MAYRQGSDQPFIGYPPLPNTLSPQSLLGNSSLNGFKAKILLCSRNGIWRQTLMGNSLLKILQHKLYFYVKHYHTSK